MNNKKTVFLLSIAFFTLLTQLTTFASHDDWLAKKIEERGYKNPIGRLCRYFHECANLEPSCTKIDDILGQGYVNAINQFSEENSFIVGFDDEIRIFKIISNEFGEHYSCTEIIHVGTNVEYVAALPEGAFGFITSYDGTESSKKVCAWKYQPSGRSAHEKALAGDHDYDFFQSYAPAKHNWDTASIALFPSGTMVHGTNDGIHVWRLGIASEDEKSTFIGTLPKSASKIVYCDENSFVSTYFRSICWWERANPDEQFLLKQEVSVLEEDELDDFVKTLPQRILDQVTYLWFIHGFPWDRWQVFDRAHRRQTLAVQLNNGDIVTADGNNILVVQTHPEDLSAKQIKLACELFLQEQETFSVWLNEEDLKTFDSFPTYLQKRYQNVVQNYSYLSRISEGYCAVQ